MESGYDKNLSGFIKWHRINVITSFGVAAVTILNGLLTILKEFTDFEAKAPFLYGKVFIWTLVAVMLPCFTLMIVSSVKAGKYRRLIEKSDDEDDDEYGPDGDIT